MGVSYKQYCLVGIVVQKWCQSWAQTKLRRSFKKVRLSLNQRVRLPQTEVRTEGGRDPVSKPSDVVSKVIVKRRRLPVQTLPSDSFNKAIVKMRRLPLRTLPSDSFSTAIVKTRRLPVRTLRSDPFSKAIVKIL